MLMKKLAFNRYLNGFAALVLGLSIVLGWLAPVIVDAAQLTNRKLTLSSSNPAGSNATTSYTFDFTTGSTNTWQSFEAQICDAATGTCNTPAGFANSSESLTSTTLSGAWSIEGSPTAGKLRASATGASSTSSGAAKQIVFGSVQNPTTSNQTFWARLTLFTTNNWTGGSQDTGTVAASTASQIILNGTNDEALTFCVGGTVGATCGSPTSGNLTFANHFSTSNPQEITSQMAAATNGSFGYNIIYTGATLTCGGCSGSPTIAAMGTQSPNGAATTSTTATSQFGLNVVANNSVTGAQPNNPFGSNISHNSGNSHGTNGTNYGTDSSFRFFTGDTVGTSSQATDFDLYTVSYLLNVSAFQAAGNYTSTLTYICTANF